MGNPKTIRIDEVEYVRADSLLEPSVDLNGMKYVIVRTYSAGCFAGYLSEREGKEVVLKNAIRLWYWSGASSLSQLAMEGSTESDKCKFAMAVNSITLTEAIEIIDTTKKAQDNIISIKSWKK